MVSHSRLTAPWMYGETLDLELEDETGRRYRASLPYRVPDELALTYCVERSS